MGTVKANAELEVETPYKQGLKNGNSKCGKALITESIDVLNISRINVSQLLFVTAKK